MEAKNPFEPGVSKNYESKSRPSYRKRGRRISAHVQVIPMAPPQTRRNPVCKADEEVVVPKDGPHSVRREQNSKFGGAEMMAKRKADAANVGSRNQFNGLLNAAFSLPDYTKLPNAVQCQVCELRGDRIRHLERLLGTLAEHIDFLEGRR